jgi:hypothetical protein
MESFSSQKKTFRARPGSILARTLPTGPHRGGPPCVAHRRRRALQLIKQGPGCRLGAVIFAPCLPACLTEALQPHHNSRARLASRETTADAAHADLEPAWTRGERSWAFPTTQRWKR